MERDTDSGGSLSYAEAEYYATLDDFDCCDTGECGRDLTTGLYEGYYDEEAFE